MSAGVAVERLSNTRRAVCRARSEAATEKRIVRAKKVLATSKRLFDVQSPADVAARLPSVQRALYLLFNEGYHGASAESTVRVEFCREAMRLVVILLDHAQGATPSSAALAALMCLAASRSPAGLDADGHLNAFADQDRSQWDQALLAEGLRLLELSSTGPELTEYHVEAAIASVHAAARRADETDWQAIVSLYDTLLTLRPSPVVALNRAIAIGRLHGPPRGLADCRHSRERSPAGLSVLLRSARRPGVPPRLVRRGQGPLPNRA